ncbi:MAG TPA: ATPase, T2SS/T4P/T4SS family [Clostridia bacterium]|nr:ATPase, T2SS/T4P/T4SS family [Clostridia bacterium]
MLPGYKEKQTWIRRIAAHLEPGSEPSDEELRRMIAAEVSTRTQGSSLTVTEKSLLIRHLFDAMRGLDILQPLLDEPDITEIMVNNPKEIYIERKGRIEKTDLTFDSSAHLTHVISRYFGRANKLVHERSPIADMRLHDGSRVHAILPPAAPNGPVLSIRRFTGIRPAMEALVDNHTLPEREAVFLMEAVRSRKNIFISGGTASGKTTFLNALAAFIPQNERVVTVEDAAELDLTGKHNLVRLEARAAAVDGGGSISLSDLIHSSLRLRPDRVIVGEVRGIEAYDMIQAMQTGHPGSMSTGHGNSTWEMLNRLSLLLMQASQLPWEACRRMVASSIDLLIHLVRQPDGRRLVEEISSVVGFGEDHFQLQTHYRASGLPSTQEPHRAPEITDRINTSSAGEAHKTRSRKWVANHSRLQNKSPSNPRVETLKGDLHV